MDKLLWIKKKLEKGDDNIYNDDSAASATL